jgi:putative NIF3 family GTP cyclohydrolase 1 type 2
MSKWLCCAFLLVLACSRAPQAERCSEDDAGRPIDTTLLAFLSRARAAHHAADQAEATGSLAQAAGLLDAVVAGPLPPGSAANAPEVREVLADTLARTADLKSRAGQFEGALSDVQRGLQHVPVPNYFQGHLYEVRGLVEERQSAALQQAGDAAAASAARARSLSALETAMKIQSEVIRGAAVDAGR